MEKLKSEVNRLNQDKDFVEFLSKKEEERLLINTLSFEEVQKRRYYYNSKEYVN